MFRRASELARFTADFLSYGHAGNRSWHCLATILALALSACAVPQPEMLKKEEVSAKPSPLTPGMAAKHIQINKTTQAEVLEIFGPPDMITKQGGGEMWGYDKVSREVAEAAVGARSSIGAAGVPVIGGAGGGVAAGVAGLIGGGYGQSSQESRRTESTTTFFMLIYFNEEGVVTDHKLSATKF